MLKEMPTPQLIEKWKKAFEENKLKPNRKTGQLFVDYLLSKYEMIPITEQRAHDVVVFNIMENEHFREKLPLGKQPKPVTYFLKNSEVFVGVDLITGWFTVENDENLWNELYAFRGLDEDDLKNYFCVAEYINCLNKQMI